MSTPAGWYDDGSGRVRWWDGYHWTDTYQTLAAIPSPPGFHLWWALSPVYSCGMVTFIPALHAAMKLQRRSLWLWALGLMVGNVGALVLIGSSPSNANGTSTPAQTVGVCLLLLLVVVGTIHAFRLRAEVFPVSAVHVQQPAYRVPVVSQTSPTMDPAVANSLAARQRRVEALELSQRDPGLARDLLIGRPDLRRQYYDGGLVDINHVPEPVLVSHLGLTPEQARSVVESRDYVGGFTNADDLTNLANVPPRVLDTVRDRIVVL